MFVPLSLDSIELNTPVPINIWDPRGVLLLRKGDVIANEHQRGFLIMRSPMAKESDYQAWNYSFANKLNQMVFQGKSISKIADATAPSELLESGEVELDPSEVWPDLQFRLTTLLHQGEQAADFVDRMVRIEHRAHRMINQGGDGSLFVLVQLLFDRQIGYSATHALLASAVCHLVAPAVGLSQEDSTSLFRAALSMNIGMARLHDDLARQEEPPSEAQRKIIREHPARGAQILRDLDVGDPLWLHLVEDHHETRSGKGYPQGKTELGTAQQLLHMADVYVARISPRISRRGLPPHQAARDIYLDQSGQPNPLGAAIVKTLGIYLPGSYVQLASGEIGVVMRRGVRANLPQVFAIIGKHGMPLGEPAMRDTADRSYQITGSVSADDVKVVLNPSKLLARM